MSTGGGNNSFDAAKVAMLARLDLSPDALTRLQGEMEAIVGYVPARGNTPSPRAGNSRTLPPARQP